MKSSSLLIASLLLTLPLGAQDPAPAKGDADKPSASKVTPIKRDGMFEFSMPGDWKVKTTDKMDLGGGKTMYPASGQSAGGGLAFFAFEDSSKKTSEVSLEELQWSVVQPIHDKMIKTGGKEETKFVTSLNPDDKDQAYFIYRIKGPDGTVVFINGIVLRTAKRCYVIQEITQTLREVEAWRAVAKSFKEL